MAKLIGSTRKSCTAAAIISGRPDGKQIVFLQMNEKDVPSYPITDWIPTHATVDQEKYPQPGDPNPGRAHGRGRAPSGGKIKWITGRRRARTASLPLGNDPNVLIPRFGWVRNGSDLGDGT